DEEEIRVLVLGDGRRGARAGAPGGDLLGGAAQAGLVADDAGLAPHERLQRGAAECWGGRVGRLVEVDRLDCLLPHPGEVERGASAVLDSRTNARAQDVRRGSVRLP